MKKRILSLSSHFSYTCKAGYKHDHINHHIENIESSSKHNSSVSAKASFTGNVGARLAISLNWLRIVESTEVGVTATLEITGELEKSVSTAQSTEKHICKICIDGNLNLSFTVDFSEKFFCIEIVGSDDLLTWKKHLTKFYVSFLNENSLVDFGWGECPHKSYLVTITVKDKDGTVPGASLLISGNGIEPIKAETNKNGVYKTYFTNGTYTAFAQSADEENFRTRLFTVKDNAIKFSIIISRDGTGPEEPEESEVPNEPGQNTAEPKRRLKTIDVGNYSVAVINEENICVREGTNTNFEDTWYWNDEDATDVISVSVAPSSSGAETFLKSDRSLWFQYWPTSSYKIADDVLYLCGRYFIKSDHSLWEYNFKYNYGSNDHGIGVYSVTLTKLMDDVAFIGGDKTKEPISMVQGNPKGLLPDFVFKTDGAIEFFSGRWPEEPPSGDWTDIVDIHGTYQNAFYVKSDGTAWAQPYEYIADGEEPIYEMVMDNVVSIEMINCGGDEIKDENNKYFQRHKNTYAVIRADGSLWMWGANDCGQIGNGTTEYQETPIKIMDDVADISISPERARATAVFAIKTDGTVWRWGRLQRVGDLTLVPERAPGIIVPLPKDIDDGISGITPPDDKTPVGSSINMQFADACLLNVYEERIYYVKAPIFFVDPNSAVNISDLFIELQKNTNIPEAQYVLMLKNQDGEMYEPEVYGGRFESCKASELFQTGLDSYDFDGLVAVYDFEDMNAYTTPYFFIASTTGSLAPTK